MFIPNGGWNRPIAKLTVTTMPKCTVSMPNDFTSGTSSGVNSRIADSGSRKQPIASSMTFTVSRNVHEDMLSDCSQATIAAGTWLTVSSQENTPAQATITRICAENSTVTEAASTISRQPSSRKTKRVTK